MRNQLLLSIAFLGFALLAQGQEPSSHTATLNIRLYSESNQLLKNEIYEGIAAQQFDVPQFIIDNYEIGRITIYGYFSSDYHVDQIRFDSRDLDLELNEFELCEQIEISIKPTLPFAVRSTDDLEGVAITRFNNRTARTEGLKSNEIILTFNQMELVSPCELKCAVRQCAVGQVVPIGIKRAGQIINHEISLEAMTYNHISYQFCSESNIKKIETPKVLDTETSTFSVFPNPTSHMSYVKFNTEAQGPVNFMVFDMYGVNIHKETITDIENSLLLSYDFKSQPSGSYLVVIEQNNEVHRSKVIYLKK